jgi:hypothetical protein
MPIGFSADYEATYLDHPNAGAAQPGTAFGKIAKSIKIKLWPSFDWTAHDIETYIDAIELKIKAKSAMHLSNQPGSD